MTEHTLRVRDDDGNTAAVTITDIAGEAAADAALAALRDTDGVTVYDPLGDDSDGPRTIEGP